MYTKEERKPAREIRREFSRDVEFREFARNGSGRNSSRIPESIKANPPSRVFGRRGRKRLWQRSKEAKSFEIPSTITTVNRKAAWLRDERGVGTMPRGTHVPRTIPRRCAGKSHDAIRVTGNWKTADARIGTRTIDRYANTERQN